METQPHTFLVLIDRYTYETYCFVRASLVRNKMQNDVCRCTRRLMHIVIWLPPPPPPPPPPGLALYNLDGFNCLLNYIYMTCVDTLTSTLCIQYLLLSGELLHSYTCHLLISLVGVNIATDILCESDGCHCKLP